MHSPHTKISLLKIYCVLRTEHCELLCNSKILKLMQRSTPRHILIPDITGHLFCDAVEKCGQCLFFPFGQQLDLPIAQITHKTRDGIPFCQMAGRIPEADTLNAAAKENLETLAHGSERWLMALNKTGIEVQIREKQKIPSHP